MVAGHNKGAKNTRKTHIWINMISLWWKDIIKTGHSIELNSTSVSHWARVYRDGLINEATETLGSTWRVSIKGGFTSARPGILWLTCYPIRKQDKTTRAFESTQQPSMASVWLWSTYTYMTVTYIPHVQFSVAQDRDSSSDAGFFTVSQLTWLVAPQNFTALSHMKVSDIL
jgi:hypothetical protein